MIAFLCSGCGKSLKVKDEFAGRSGRCPHCQKPMTVPTAAEAARARAARGDADDTDADARTVLPSSSPRGSSGVRKGNTPAPAAAAGAELYDFLAPPQAADEIGRLGAYRVLKVLGAGGMGVVFQAEDPRLGRLVALKAMLPALAASGSNKERFLREARTAAAVEHDHIVPIYQVDEDRGVPFIAMPFLRGESLEDRLKRQRKLPVAEALRIARETAEGLSAAHERGLVHRDIKPANVWLEGDKGRAKILDFGLARASGGESNLTQQGMIIGTPAYMAPEQGAGKPVDTRCDLFSLGVVLYHMLTGKLPFGGGGDMVATLVAVATEAPAPPRQLNPAVSPRLSKLVMDLLAKSPQDRPPSALSVVDLIEEIEKEPAEDVSEADEPAVRVVRVVREEPPATVRAAPEEDYAEPPPAGEPPRRSLMVPVLIGCGLGLFALVALAGVGLAVYLNSGKKPEVAQNPPPANNPPPARPRPQPAPINPAPRDPDPVRNPGGNVVSPRPRDNDPPRKPDEEPPAETRPKPRPKPAVGREADRTFRPYTSAVRRLVFAPDGKHFFSLADGNSQMDYWDLESDKPLRHLALNAPVRHCVLSADGKYVLAYHEGQLLVWEVGSETAPPRPAAPRLGEKIIGAGFTADGQFRVALESQVGRFPQQISVVQIYDSASNKILTMPDPRTRKPVPMPLQHPQEASRAWFSPDGKRVLTWSRDRTFRTWDLEARRLAAAFAPSPKEFKSADVSADFKRLLGTFHEADVRLYDLAAGTELKAIKPQDHGDTDAVAFGADNTTAVAGGWGSVTRVLDLDEGKVKQELRAGAVVTAVALSPDGKTVLSGDSTGSVFIHKLDE